MTPDEIISVCKGTDAQDWRYWTYAPWAGSGQVVSTHAAATRGSARAYSAGALLRADVTIGLAWGIAEPGETGGHDWPPEFAARVREARWIDLLHKSHAVARYLAVLLDGQRAMLPAPSVERRAGGLRTLWVSSGKLAVVRLANEIDPGCSGFDECFARSGIEVR